MYNICMQVISLKYRLFPTSCQVRSLEQTLNTCRQTYNWLLSDREESYETKKVSISYFEQKRRITVFRETWEELQNIHSQVLQNVAVRVELAFQAFFRRIKSGEKPGYPRYKGKDWYDSFTYPQSGFSIKDDRLKLSKIGDVKIKLHRPIVGKIKSCNIRRNNDKWYACFMCEIENEFFKDIDQSVGIDVGILNFAALSDGSFVENPKFFKTDMKALAKSQRKLFKQNKVSKKRRKAKKVVSRIHERIKNRRHNFVHQLSRKIVNEYGTIVVEKLNIKAMKSDIHNINRSIGDVAWGMFRNILSYKAVNAGRKYVEVNPAYTSQDCSGCDFRAKKPLKERWHHCPICGISLDRDTNAAINILALGLQSLQRQSLIKAISNNCLE